LAKKLAPHILEIHYYILKDFTPQQLFLTKEKEEAARQEIYSEQKNLERRRKFLKSIRHSKFGT